MSIESEFSHRGFPVRLKFRGIDAQRPVYHLFILTDRGPYFDTASSIFEAKSKAVSIINDWTSGDWTHSTGAVLGETGNGDDIRPVSRIRRDETKTTIASPISGTSGQKGRLPTFGSGGYISTP